MYKSPVAVGESSKQRTWLRRVITRYDKSHANNWATIIAWNALFSFIPILLGLVAVFSLLLNQRGFNTFVVSHIAAAAHTRAERQSILQSLSTFRSHAGTLLAGVLIATLWSGSAFFSALDNGLSHLFGVAARPFVRKRLRGMVMVFVFAVLLVPLLASSSLISLAHTYGFFPNHSAAEIFVIQLIVGLAVGLLLFLLIYLNLPNRKLRIRQILPGAVFAGISLELLSLIFPLYIKGSSDFTNYGLIFGLALLTITFFYLLAQIIVVGAVISVEADPRLRLTSSTSLMSLKRPRRAGDRLLT